MTTKQLRQDMASVIRDLKKGTPVKLTYRGQVIGVLQPSGQAKPRPAFRRGSPEAILDFIENNDFAVPKRVRNDKRPIKEVVRQLRDKDLGL